MKPYGDRPGKPKREWTKPEREAFLRAPKKHARQSAREDIAVELELEELKRKLVDADKRIIDLEDIISELWTIAEPWTASGEEIERRVLDVLGSRR